MGGLSWTLRHHRAVISVADYLAGYVDLRRVTGYCRGCPSLGTTWACPPHESDPLAIWADYRWLHLVVVQLCFSASDRRRRWATDEMLAALTAAREQVKASATARLLTQVAGVAGARVLYGGGACTACRSCTRPAGRPCPHPERIQYSLESLGADVARTTAELLGVELCWAGDDRLPPATAVVLGVLTQQPLGWSTPV